MKGPNRSQRRADRPRGRPKTTRRLRAGLGLASVASLSLLFAGGAQAANPPVNLASAGFFSVLAGSTVTNTGPTTMFGDLGLYPGTSITGAPDALGATYINDPVALDAQNDLVTAFTDAANRPSIALASADLSGQNFTPGVYKASSSLLFSAGDVTLNAEGDPNAVFIFQIGSSMTTQSATTVLLINGAQPCNVFWEVGASATLGTNSRFIGTVMAQTSITAQTGATLDGRLLAQNGAVTLDTNTITTSACAAGTTGGPPATTGGAPTTTTTAPGATGTPVTAGTPATPGAAVPGTPVSTTTVPAPPVPSKSVPRKPATPKKKTTTHKHAKAKPKPKAKAHTPARPETKRPHGSFTG